MRSNSYITQYCKYKWIERGKRIMKVRRNVVVIGIVALVAGIAGVVLKVSKSGTKNKWCRIASKEA